MLSLNTEPVQQSTTQPIVNVQTVIVDFTEQGAELINFLYKVFSYNPVVHFSQLPKISFYTKLILHHVVSGLNDERSFITNVHDNVILNEIADPDLLYFQAHADELSFLLLYLLKHLSDYICVTETEVCLLHTYTLTYLMMDIYAMNIEANDLVF